MYHYHNTPARLAAWRKHAAEMAALYVKRGADVPEEYARPSLPRPSFGQVSPASVNREPYESDGKTPRTPTYNYGEGLGGKTVRPFRFKGFADECEGGPDHTGWYGDDEGSGYTMFRGVVFQIPGREGEPIYLAGCEWGEQGARGKFDTGGGWIEIGRGDTYDNERDAARAADSIAEHAAEAERDYQREERAKEDAAEETREREEAERIERHEAAVAAALESTLKLAGQVCNLTGHPGSIPEPLHTMIGKMQDALHEYDSLMLEGPSGEGEDE
jgi:hypothetical protein